MNSNMEYIDLIEDILLEQENLNKEIEISVVIDQLFNKYWNTENLWLKNRWKIFRMKDGETNLLIDLKTEFRNFKSDLRQELDFDFTIQLKQRNITKRYDNEECFLEYNDSAIFKDDRVEESEPEIEETVFKGFGLNNSSSEPISRMNRFNISESIEKAVEVKSFGGFPLKEEEEKIEESIEDNGQRRNQFAKTNSSVSHQELYENKKTKRKEKYMHSVLVKYLRENEYFRAYSKTIDQSKSDNKIKGKNEWDHADIVAVNEEIYLNTKNQVLNEFLEIANQDFLKIFSFELKLKVDLPHLREYFFQAVSNSSWAHEGYLVTLEIDKRQNRHIKEELKRLSSTFGIGVILLNPYDISKTEIVFPARKNDRLDLTLINKLLTISKNKDFQEFIKSINDIKKTKEVNVKKFDEVLSARGLAEHIRKFFYQEELDN